MNIATALLAGAGLVAAGGGLLLPSHPATAIATQSVFVLPTANPIVAPPAPAFSLSPLSNPVSRTFQFRNLSPTNFLARIRPLPAAGVKPGLYKSEPYACLVVVPDGHLDDKCLVPARHADPRMPVQKPELRLVPYAKR